MKKWWLLRLCGIAIPGLALLLRPLGEAMLPILLMWFITLWVLAIRLGVGGVGGLL